MPKALVPLFMALIGLQLSGCTTGGTRPSWLGDAGGNKVLSKGRQMVDSGVVLPGSCWDYINAVYNRAGYPESKRKYLYKTDKKGPYASASLIKPGDWVYFVNHSYGNIEHSSIFVEWMDKGRKQARMLSYAGERRREPGRYISYDLSSVFGIIRAVP